MIKYILALILLIAGCMKGVNQRDIPKQINYKEIEITVQKFSYIFDVFVDSQLIFTPRENNSLFSGQSATCVLQTNTIYIDRDFWLDTDTEVREALLFHELGHCLLGLGHSVPNSVTIMSSFIGYTVNAYTYFYDESIAYLKSAECEHGCDLARIQINRSKR